MENELIKTKIENLIKETKDTKEHRILGAQRAS